MKRKTLWKLPVIFGALFLLFVTIVSAFLWVNLCSRAGSLTAAAGLNPAQIEYATVRTRGPNGALTVRKISNPAELAQLYSRLSSLAVRRRLSLGARSSNADASVTFKLRDNGTLCIADKGNSFAAQNTGLFSAFFVHYFDSAHPQALSAADRSFLC